MPLFLPNIPFKELVHPQNPVYPLANVSCSTQFVRPAWHDNIFDIFAEVFEAAKHHLGLDETRSEVIFTVFNQQRRLDFLDITIR